MYLPPSSSASYPTGKAWRKSWSSRISPTKSLWARPMSPIPVQSYFCEFGTDKRRVRRGNRQFIEAPKTAASHHFGDLRCLCPHSDPKSALKFSTNHRDNDYTRRPQFVQSYENCSKGLILAYIILYSKVLL